jgi:transposase
MLYYKRLERGVFELPKYEISAGLILLSYTEMIMILDGISILNTTKNKCYLNDKNNLLSLGYSITYPHFEY